MARLRIWVQNYSNSGLEFGALDSQSFSKVHSLPSWARLEMGGVVKLWVTDLGVSTTKVLLLRGVYRAAVLSKTRLSLITPEPQTGDQISMT